MDRIDPFAQYMRSNKQREFAEKLRDECGVEVTQGAISQWLKKGVPPKRVAAVSKITGIPTHHLRPDVFPPPDAAA